MLDLEMTVVTMAHDIANEVAFQNEVGENPSYILGMVEGVASVISTMIFRNIGVSVAVAEVRDLLRLTDIIPPDVRIARYRELILSGIS